MNQKEGENQQKKTSKLTSGPQTHAHTCTEHTPVHVLTYAHKCAPPQVGPPAGMWLHVLVDVRLVVEALLSRVLFAESFWGQPHLWGPTGRLVSEPS